MEHIPRVSGKTFAGQRVAVAYNRHECLVAHPPKPNEHCFPVREKPTTSSKVLGYADELWLKDARFFVSPAGVDRIRRTGARTPIAFVVGTVVKDRPRKVSKKHGWSQVRFDPFKSDCFAGPRGGCLSSAKYVHLGDRQVRAFGVDRGAALTSLRQLNPELELVTPQRDTWQGDMGGLNYGRATPEALEAALDQVWARWPGAVILDGTDDWDAPEKMRPETFPRTHGANPLARWHTGMSGQAASGLIFEPEAYRRLEARYRAAHGHGFEDAPAVRKAEEPNSCGCWQGSGFTVYRGPQSSANLKRRLMR